MTTEKAIITKDFDVDDVFLMSEIIEKMDISIELDKYMNPSNTTVEIPKDIEKESEEVRQEILKKLDNEAEQKGKQMFMKAGIDLGITFVKKMHKAKKEVKKLIANLTGKTMDEVSKMNLKELKQFFKELIEKEGFEDFLNSVEE